MLAARADLFCFSTLLILSNVVNMALFDDLLSLGQGQEHTIEVVNLLGRQVDLTLAGLPVNCPNHLPGLNNLMPVTL